MQSCAFASSARVLSTTDTDTDVSVFLRVGRYNPVLGEFFRCRYDYPDGSKGFYIAEQGTLTSLFVEFLTLMCSL